MGNSCSLENQEESTNNISQIVTALALDFVNTRCVLYSSAHSQSVVLLKEFQRYLKANMSQGDFEEFIVSTTPNLRLQYILDICNDVEIAYDRQGLNGIALVPESD